MVNIPTIYGDDWWMAYYCYTHISPRVGWLAWENTSKERRVGGDWNMFFRVDDDVFSILEISNFYFFRGVDYSYFQYLLVWNMTDFFRILEITIPFESI